MKLVTILFLQQADRVLLAMKKRGFGAGKWNGVGGKVDSGETARQAAFRECQEEIGIIPIDPKPVGRLKFYEKIDSDFDNLAHVYLAKKWQGKPVETEEMRPKWFKMADIPYDSMWPDDQHWYPLMFAGKLFEATFTLNGNVVDSYNIDIVPRLRQY